jgi:hypothetical protein
MQGAATTAPTISKRTIFFIAAHTTVSTTSILPRDALE